MLLILIANPDSIVSLHDVERHFLYDTHHAHTIDASRHVIVETIDGSRIGIVTHDASYLLIGKGTTYRDKHRLIEIGLQACLICLIKCHNVIGTLGKINILDILWVMGLGEVHDPCCRSGIGASGLPLETTITTYLVALDLIRAWLNIRKTHIEVVAVETCVLHPLNPGSKGFYGFSLNVALAEDVLSCVDVLQDRFGLVQLRVERLVGTADLSVCALRLLFNGLIGKLSHHLADDVPMVTPTDTKRVHVLLYQANDIATLPIATKEGLLRLVVDMAHNDGISPTSSCVRQYKLDVSA